MVSSIEADRSAPTDQGAVSLRHVEQRLRFRDRATYPEGFGTSGAGPLRLPRPALVAAARADGGIPQNEAMLAPGTDQATTADWVAAIGQVAGAVFTALAVAVALWIALADARRRRRDDETRAWTRARMVLIRGTGVRSTGRDEHGFHHELLINFTNHGDRPIFDVYAEAWSSGHSLEQKPPWAVTSEIVKPGEPEEFFLMKVTTKEPTVALAAWRVRWTDVDGRQWFGDQVGQYQPMPYTGEPPRMYMGQPDRDRHGERFTASVRRMRTKKGLTSRSSD
jgi:hypothetical protein